MYCKECKWWGKLEYEDYDSDSFEVRSCVYIGKCSKIVHQGMSNNIAFEQDNENFIAGTYDGEDYSSGLITGANFGCTLFEKK